MTRLSPEQLDKQATIIAELFIRALVQGTDAAMNKAHEVSPCPVSVWEEGTWLDVELNTPPMVIKDANSDAKNT
jgi:hypothetical protein